MNEETDKAGSVPGRLNRQWSAREMTKSAVQGNEVSAQSSGFVVVLI